MEGFSTALSEITLGERGGTTSKPIRTDNPLIQSVCGFEDHVCRGRKVFRAPVKRPPILALFICCNTSAAVPIKKRLLRVSSREIIHNDRGVAVAPCVADKVMTNNSLC